MDKVLAERGVDKIVRGTRLGTEETGCVGIQHKIGLG